MPLFEEEFTVSAAPEAVWDFLLDPQRVAPCLPGCESVDRVGQGFGLEEAERMEAHAHRGLDATASTASMTLA